MQMIMTKIQEKKYKKIFKGKWNRISRFKKKQKEIKRTYNNFERTI